MKLRLLLIGSIVDTYRSEARSFGNSSVHWIYSCRIRLYLSCFYSIVYYYLRIGIRNRGILFFQLLFIINKYEITLFFRVVMFFNYAMFFFGTIVTDYHMLNSFSNHSLNSNAKRKSELRITCRPVLSNMS